MRIDIERNLWHSVRRIHGENVEERVNEEDNYEHGMIGELLL